MKNFLSYLVSFTKTASRKTLGFLEVLPVESLLRITFDH